MRKCVKVKEAANALSCSVSSIYRLLENGELQGFRLGKKGIKVYEDSLEAFAQKSQIGPKKVVSGQVKMPKTKVKRRVRIMTRTGSETT